MALFTPDPNRYTPLTVLRQGVSGTVSLLEEKTTGRWLVGHKLREPGAHSAVKTSRVMDSRGGRLKRLDHPGLASFRQIGRGPSGHWFLFDFKAGYPLHLWTHHTDKLPTDWILWWTLQLLETLEYLHGLEPEYVVGALDPHDVIITRDGPVIINPGLVENLYPESAALFTSSERAMFVAPEQRNLARRSPAADVFSVGAVAYWLLTGTAPSVSEPSQFAWNIQARRPSLSMEIVSVITELIWPSPKHRHENGRLARAALLPHAPDLQGKTPPASPVPFEYSETPTIPLAPSQPPLDPSEPAAARTPSPASGAAPPSPPASAGFPTQGAAPHAPVALKYVLLELADEFVWRVMKGSLAFRATVWGLAAVLLLSLGVGLYASTRRPPPPPPGLALKSGKVYVKVLGGTPEWQELTHIGTPGSLFEIGSRDAATVLGFGQGSTISAPGRTTSRFIAARGDTIELNLVRGQMVVRTSTADRARIAMPGASAECEIDTEARFDMLVKPPQIVVPKGRVQTNHGVLEAGDRLELGDRPRIVRRP